MYKFSIKILLLTFCFLLLASNSFADLPASTNYKLVDYGFGSAIATSSSGNYTIMGTLGELNIASMSSANFSAESGLVFTLKAEVPPMPTVSNPATNYDRLKIIINVGGNPSDATYALGISTDNFGSDIRYIKSNKTVGNTLTSTDFQDYTTWGGGGGFFVTGLMPHTTYYIRVKSSQGNYTESEFGPAGVATTSDSSLTFGLDTESITFNNLNAGNSYTDSSKSTVMTTSTNAYNGYIIYGEETQPLTAAPSVTISDYGASNETPTTWSGTGFGYNSNDSDLQTGPGLANRFSGSKYSGFSSSQQDPVADHTTVVENPAISNETFTVAYKVIAPSTVKAGNYQNTIIYTVVPIY